MPEILKISDLPNDGEPEADSEVVYNRAGTTRRGTVKAILQRLSANALGLTGIDDILTNLGGTAVGRAVFRAVDAAGARASLGLSFVSKAVAEAGTAEDGSMNPLRTAQAISKRALGVGQTWRSVTRDANTSYENTTGRPIQLAGRVFSPTATGMTLSISENGSDWLSVVTGLTQGSFHAVAFSGVVVPAGHFYQITTNAPGDTTITIRELSDA